MTTLRGPKLLSVNHRPTTRRSLPTVAPTLNRVNRYAKERPIFSQMENRSNNCILQGPLKVYSAEYPSLLAVYLHIPINFHIILSTAPVPRSPCRGAPHLQGALCCPHSG